MHRHRRTPVHLQKYNKLSLLPAATTTATELIYEEEQHPDAVSISTQENRTPNVPHSIHVNEETDKLVSYSAKFPHLLSTPTPQAASSPSSVASSLFSSSRGSTPASSTSSSPPSSTHSLFSASTRFSVSPFSTESTPSAYNNNNDNNNNRTTSPPSGQSTASTVSPDTNKQTTCSPPAAPAAVSSVSLSVFPGAPSSSTAAVIPSSIQSPSALSFREARARMMQMKAAHEHQAEEREEREICNPDALVVPPTTLSASAVAFSPLKLAFIQSTPFLAHLLPPTTTRVGGDKHKATYRQYAATHSHSHSRQDDAFDSPPQSPSPCPALHDSPPSPQSSSSSATSPTHLSPSHLTIHGDPSDSELMQPLFSPVARLSFISPSANKTKINGIAHKRPRNGTTRTMVEDDIHNADEDILERPGSGKKWNVVIHDDIQSPSPPCHTESHSDNARLPSAGTGATATASRLPTSIFTSVLKQRRPVPPSTLQTLPSWLQNTHTASAGASVATLSLNTSGLSPLHTPSSSLSEEQDSFSSFGWHGVIHGTDTDRLYNDTPTQSGTSQQMSISQPVYLSQASRASSVFSFQTALDIQTEQQQQHPMQEDEQRVDSENTGTTATTSTTTATVSSTAGVDEVMTVPPSSSIIIAIATDQTAAASTRISPAPLSSISTTLMSQEHSLDNDDHHINPDIQTEQSPAASALPAYTQPLPDVSADTVDPAPVVTTPLKGRRKRGSTRSQHTDHQPEMPTSSTSSQICSATVPCSTRSLRAGPASNTWVCLLCTYENVKTQLTCTMCQQARGRKQLDHALQLTQSGHSSLPSTNDSPSTAAIPTPTVDNTQKKRKRRASLHTISPESVSSTQQTEKRAKRRR